MKKEVICVKDDDSNGDGCKTTSQWQKGEIIKPQIATVRDKNLHEMLLRALLKYYQSEGQLELKLLLSTLPQMMKDQPTALVSVCTVKCLIQCYAKRSVRWEMKTTKSILGLSNNEKRGEKEECTVGRSRRVNTLLYHRYFNLNSPSSFSSTYRLW